MQCIFNPSLDLFHLNFASRAHIDLRHPASQLGQTFLQLFPIIVARGSFDFLANLFDPTLDVFTRPTPLDDRRVIIVDGYLSGRAQIRRRHAIQFDTQILKDRLAAGEDRDIFQHGLAPIPITRRLDRSHIDHAPQLINHQRSQGLAFDVLSDDQ